MSEATDPDGPRTWRAQKWIGRARCFAVPEPDDGARHPLPLEGALPGELVYADDQTSPYKRWLRTTEVLEASEHRIEPTCPHAATCPGCSLLHTTEAAEDRYKALVVAEVFARELGEPIAVDDVGVVAPARRGGHRARATLSLQVRAGAPPRLGLRARDGEIVHAPECPANHPLIAQSLHELIAAIPEDIDDFDASVTLFAGRVPHLGTPATELLLCFAAGTPGTITKRFADEPERLMRGPISAVRVQVADDNPRELPWELVGQGTRLLPLPVGPLQLTQPLGAWSPPTPGQSEQLYAWIADRVRTHLGPELDGLRLLDVGCGTGGVSISLAREGLSVVGLDVDVGAFESATHSVFVANHERGASLDAEFRGGKAETVLPRLVRDGEHFDVVTINPFRRALGPATMQAVHDLGARLVIYLAPSAIAGAKDVAALTDAGFERAELAVANLHPGAHALLALAVLVRPVRPSA